MARNDSLESIKKDLEKRVKASLKDMAEEISFQIENAYENVIEQFYDDYTPDYYNRTYSSYLGSNHYDNPFEVMSFGLDHFAGIQVDASNIPGNPYRATKQWVFERTFYQGIHGTTISELRERNKGKHRSEEVRFKTAKKMSPPPKRVMDKKFKQIVKKRNMDSIWESVKKKYDL